MLTKHEGLTPKALLKDQRGLTTVEYIIVLVLIAVCGFAIWRKFGGTAKNKTSDSNALIDERASTTSTIDP